jgi:hypothetical protein
MWLDLPVYAALALFGGIYLFFTGFRDLQRLRLIENTPTARIRSMAMGLVEVNGVIEGRSTQFSPFSNQPCAYWQVEIAVRNGRRNTWSTIHRNASGQPFFLRDETGLAMVYPKGSDCQVGHTIEETAHGLMMPDCYSDYMKENGIWMRHVASLSSLRFRERTLEGGERVYVLGTAVPRAQVLCNHSRKAISPPNTVRTRLYGSLAANCTEQTRGEYGYACLTRPRRSLRRSRSTRPITNRAHDRCRSH